jgi:hypothetical protein
VAVLSAEALLVVVVAPLPSVASGNDKLSLQDIAEEQIGLVFNLALEVKRMSDIYFCHILFIPHIELFDACSKHAVPCHPLCHVTARMSAAILWSFLIQISSVVCQKKNYHLNRRYLYLYLGKI